MVASGPGTVPDLSLTEWVVLAVLGEKPAHGFAIAKELRAANDLGRILTVQRSLVYRALDRLVAAGLVEALHTEPGDSGPNRTLHRPTRRGRTAADRWLDRPVAHVRELRMEFLAKLRLNDRRRRDPTSLILSQRTALSATFERLSTEPGEDAVDLWRHHNARAAQAFLESLAT